MTNRSTSTLLLLAVVALCAMAPAPPSPFYPVAVWYCGGTARAPMLSTVTPDSPRAWRADLAAIKALGFNTVRTWVEWSAGEAREGEYRFENLELLLRLADDVGLKVIVQVYVDSAPEWVGHKYPDGKFVSQDGTALPSQAAPGYCFDHPGVREAVLAFFREVARRAARSPAFHAYDLWSEPAVMNWALPIYLPNAQFCYCPHSQARFRAWLHREYPSLDALNASWYRTFAEWNEVEPPRFGTILTYADFVDWRVYIGDKIAADLAARAAAVRSVDASHVVTSHAPNPSPVFRTLADPADASDDYLMTDVVDYFGTSFYPKLTSPDRDWPLERRVLVMDAVRSVTRDRGFYVGELQAGPGVHGIVVGNPITPEDLALNTWGLVARGARAVSYYAYYPMSSGYESGGYGLVNLDGTPTDRARAAGATARALAANADLLLAAQPVPAQVAIVFNPLVPLLGGEQAYGDRRTMHRALAGYHRMFFERNLAVDIPSARALDAAALRRYRLVIVPSPLLLTRGMADALERIVREGGHLFVEARPGWQDDHGHAEPVVPGFGWDRMLGVRESELRPVDEVQVRWNEKSFTGAAFAERFEPLTDPGRIVATYADGTPAAYARRHGQGEAIVLGTLAGERNALKPVAGHPLGDLLAEWAGLDRPALRSSAFVELRRLSAAGGELLFLFNHGAEPALAQLEVPLAKPATRLAEIVEGTRLTATGSVFSQSTTIPAGGVRVFRVDY